MASICVPPFLQASAKAFGLDTFMANSTTLDVFSEDPAKLQEWAKLNHLTVDCVTHQMVARYHTTPNLLGIPTDLQEHVQNAATSPFYTIGQLRTIYEIPAPSTSSVVVGVVSFGGGLYGTVDSNGVLTNGDVQNYWSSIGIPVTNHPKVIIVPIQGARNIPNINDGGSTIENTIDVETVGGICPSSQLTIILYIAPNSLSQFSNMLNYMYNNPVVVNGVSYKPNIVSCSWGAPEVYYPSTTLSSINSVMSAMTSAGMNICVATGDNGSNDGVGGTSNYVDFPSSSPNALAVGGTSLVCPNRAYDADTVETAWSSGGGGISRMYGKPTYQNAIPGSGRSTPDIALIADPNTGVIFIINGQTMVIGGTSVAAPIMAGFLLAINCRTFVTPLLYRAPLDCFHEIMIGSNGGYVAEAGYDNVTGWGSLNGNKLASFIANPNTAPVPVSSIVLYPTSVTLFTGQTSPFTSTVFPSNATNPAIRWASSDATIAYVNNQQILAISPGSAIITATAADSSAVNATISVNVSPVLVSSITLSPSIVTLAPSQTAMITASVQPSNAYNPSIRWVTTDSTIVTVSNGLLTAVKVGTATISAQSVDGSAVSASITVSVRPLVVPVTAIGLSQVTASLLPSSTIQLNATYLPVNATETTTTWSSNNGNASITSNGLVTANTPGTSIITASVGSVTASCTITILIPVSAISIQQSSLTVSIGSTKSLTTTILPSNAANRTVTWSSSDAGIASVTSNGVVRGIAGGTVSITAQCQTKSASIPVTVSVPVQSITLNDKNITLTRGSTYKAIATIQPSNASQTTITWQSLVPSVASVNSDGLITAKSNGTTMITVKSFDGTRMASMIVRVLTTVASVRLNTATITIRVNTTSQLSAILTPIGVSNPTVVWSSSMPSVASVTPSGLVSGVSQGTAVITAITANGSLTSTCTVTVI